jgi:hypothetical protein
MAPQKLQPRHPQWRRTYRAGPTMPTWQPVPRHWQWRRTTFCHATVNGAAKKVSPVNFFTRGLFFTFVPSLGYSCLNCPMRKEERRSGWVIVWFPVWCGRFRPWPSCDLTDVADRSCVRSQNLFRGVYGSRCVRASNVHTRPKDRCCFPSKHASFSSSFFHNMNQPREIILIHWTGGKIFIHIASGPKYVRV